MHIVYTAFVALTHHHTPYIYIALLKFREWETSESHLSPGWWLMWILLLLAN